MRHILLVLCLLASILALLYSVINIARTITLFSKSAACEGDGSLDDEIPQIRTNVQIGAVFIALLAITLFFS